METKQRETPLTGKEGAEIDIKVAADWTQNHRHRNPNGVISQFFGQELLNKILQQPDCIGIRFYYANSKPLSGWQRFMKKCFKKDEGEVHLIITGVTKEGIDQLPHTGNTEEAHAFKSNVKTSSGGGAVGEQSVPCPGGVGCPQNVLTGE